MGIAIKDFILSYYTLEMYKLYQFAMPFTTKAKNLLLIIQNLIFFKIYILAKILLLYCISPQMSAVGEREGGWGLPLQDRLRAV